VAPGKVVAELGFGFWRYLTSSAHEATLWTPVLHRAFPPGTDRARDVDRRIEKLHVLRNRVAHHEPLLNVDLQARLADMLALASLLNPELAIYVDQTTQLRRLAAIRASI